MCIICPFCCCFFKNIYCMSAKQHLLKHLYICNRQCDLFGVSSIFVILYVFLFLQPATILVCDPCPYPTSPFLFTVPGLIYGLLLLLLSDIVEYCKLWLPLQTPCHCVPCTVTAGAPWGPYIHSNWFGKDLAAFELQKDRERGEWGGEMEGNRQSMRRERGGNRVCMDGYFLGSSLSSFKKNKQKTCSDSTDILKQYIFYSWITTLTCAVMHVACKVVLKLDRFKWSQMHSHADTEGADKTCQPDRKLSIKNDLWKLRLFWSQTYHCPLPL